MRTTIHLLLMAASLLALSSATSRADFSFAYDHRAYLLVTSSKNWTNAQTDAVSRGGTLARIDSAAENTVILTNLLNRGISSRSSDGGGSVYVWIGGRETVEGTYAWTARDGSLTTYWTNGSYGGAVGGLYVNWARNATEDGGPEPDNYAGTQDRMAIALESWPNGATIPIGQPGEWNDIRLRNSLNYLVEFPPVSLAYVANATNVTVTWSTNYIGWVLQAQTNSTGVGLLPDVATWHNVSGTETTNTYSAPIVNTNGCVFFRLKQP